MEVALERIYPFNNLAKYHGYEIKEYLPFHGKTLANMFTMCA